MAVAADSAQRDLTLRLMGGWVANRHWRCRPGASRVSGVQSLWSPLGSVQTGTPRRGVPAAVWRLGKALAWLGGPPGPPSLTRSSLLFGRERAVGRRPPGDLLSAGRRRERERLLSLSPRTGKVVVLLRGEGPRWPLSRPPPALSPPARARSPRARSLAPAPPPPRVRTSLDPGSGGLRVGR